jgi:AcrR family transcriptional regulator
MPEASRTPLSRARILDAALRFVDEYGLDALSMRKLASELGVEAMSLYNHVPSKGAVLDGLLERLLDEIDVRPGGDRHWTDRVRAAARSFRRLALRHPSFVQLLTRQHVHSEATMRPLEASLSILRQAGFGPEEALLAYKALIGYVIGFVTQEVSGALGLPDCGPEDQVELGGGLEVALDPERFPVLTETLPLRQRVRPDAAFDFGLDLILAGLHSRLAAGASKGS